MEGSVKVSVPGTDTQPEITVKELGRGDMFGELALLTDHPRSANVTAATDVDLMLLNKDVFQQEVLSDPSHLYSVLSMLSNRLTDTLDLLACQTKG